jgi:hypothetical protein
LSRSGARVFGAKRNERISRIPGSL